MKPAERARVRQMPTRGSYEASAIHKILDAGFLAHVGFVVDGQPFVIPTLYARVGDRIYMHGSTASRLVRELATGIAACLTVTLVDGFVLARSAFHHSINYRSVVAFGTARSIQDMEHKARALQSISEHVVRGRWNEVRKPTQRELQTTAVLEFSIEEASAKVRTGPALDDEEDYDLPVWAGVIPAALRLGCPVPDGRLREGIDLPESVRAFVGEKELESAELRD